MPRILIACEESQAVTKEFRALGFEAYSCDLEECSGGHPEWHIQGCVHKLFQTDGFTPTTWDMVIAFPPCTHLAVSGAKWFKEKQADGRQQEAIDFFMMFANLRTERVAIENPVSIMSTKYRKPDQIIQPWWFGHPEKKSTCLWLKNLPPLVQTDNVYKEMMKLPKKKRERLHYMAPSPDRGKLRSKTFPGVAKAMAEQWSKTF